MVFLANRRIAMAQQNTAADEAQTENDPELAAATEAEAVQSLQVHLGRDAMREFGREHDSRASGTKQEMAESMMQEAREQALGVLAEEGVELLGDLAEDDEQAQAQDSEAEQDAVEAVAAQDDLGEDTDEQADEDDSGRQRTPVGEMLRQHPEDYHRDSSLGFSEKQVELLAWAMHHAGDVDEQVAEAQECSARYVNSVCHRWPASDEGIAAIEDAGHEVPDYYQETDAPEGED